jgi:hypothetical protein
MPNTQNNHSDYSQKKLRLFDYVVFGVAVFLLAVILYVGKEGEAKENILYLVALSLATSMTFAFLPFDANFEYKGLFRAGGTAAIFGFSLYIVTSFTEHGFATQKKSSDAQITALSELLKEKDKLISIIQEANKVTVINSGEECKKRISYIIAALQPAVNSLDLLKSDVAEGIQFSSAARDNSSDSRTCSLRGSQGLAALSRATPRLDIVQSSVATAVGLGK